MPETVEVNWCIHKGHFKPGAVAQNIRQMYVENLPPYVIFMVCVAAVRTGGSNDIRTQ